MKTKYTFLLVTVCLLITFQVSKAQDSPQFPGPEKDSKSPQKGLLRNT